MPVSYDYEFIDGFDKYGPPGMIYPSFGHIMVQGEWTSLPTIDVNSSISLVTPPDNSRGCAFSYFGRAFGVQQLYKTVPNRFARCIGGVSQTTNFLNANYSGIIGLYDGGKPQINIWVNTVGQIVVTVGYRVNAFGILTVGAVYTSLESVGANSSHFFEWDILVHPTAGHVKVWLDGVLTTIDFTGINTSFSGNAYYDGIGLAVDNGEVPFGPGQVIWDHLYTWHYLSGVALDTPLLTNPIIATDWPIADSAVNFAADATILGEAFSYSGTYDNLAANTVMLMKFTPIVNMTINEVSFLSNTTSGTAKFKAVVYSDNGAGPHTLPLNLLSDGVELIGINGGVIQRCSLLTPVNLTAGTDYWIGFYSDTAVGILRFNDLDFSSVAKGTTYASGAPATISGATTGTRPYMFYGNCTNSTDNYVQVTNTLLNPPLGDLQFNSSATAGDEDLFNFPPLASNTVNVYTVAVKAYLRRTEPGYRLMDMRAKSGTTDGAGSTPAQAPPASFGWVASYFDNDPDIAAPWTPTAVNASTEGYEINA